MASSFPMFCWVTIPNLFEPEPVSVKVICQPCWVTLRLPELAVWNTARAPDMASPVISTGPIVNASMVEGFLTSRPRSVTVLSASASLLQPSRLDPFTGHLTRLGLLQSVLNGSWLTKSGEQAVRWVCPDTYGVLLR